MSATRTKRRRPLPIIREPDGEGFAYRFDGRRITAKRELDRISALAIPPAWSNVEIARSPSAKVLARGLDAAGRIQAIYHPSYRQRQDRQKFARLERFAVALPKLRAAVDRDLRRRRLSRDRVVACAIRLIDLQWLRVGNSEYARKHRSFGVTTLRRTHVQATRTAVELDFPGKSGRRHRRRVADPRVARVMVQLLELPGAEVFRFFDDDAGEVHDLTSRHVNAYVKQAMGDDFSAKDFRTWGGTLIAVGALLRADTAQFETPTSRAALARDIVREVAERLGNTPAVAKSSYLDPRVLQAIENARVLARVRRARTRMRPRKHFGVEEQCVLALLRATPAARS